MLFFTSSCVTSIHAQIFCTPKINYKKKFVTFKWLSLKPQKEFPPPPELLRAYCVSRLNIKSRSAQFNLSLSDVVTAKVMGRYKGKFILMAKYPLSSVICRMFPKKDEWYEKNYWHVPDFNRRYLKPPAPPRRMPA